MGEDNHEYFTHLLLIGVLYLLIGVVMGMYIGGSVDHTLSPVYAHVNLAGFVLMAVLSGGYRAFLTMAETGLVAKLAGHANQAVVLGHYTQAVPGGADHWPR